MVFWASLPEASPEDRTLWVGNLGDEVTSEILEELFFQAGPLKKMVLPKDERGQTKRFAFVEFKHEVSVPYALELMNGVALFGRPLRCQYRPNSCHARGEKVMIDQFLDGEKLAEPFKGTKQKEEDASAMRRSVSYPSALNQRGYQQQYNAPPTQFPSLINQQGLPPNQRQGLFPSPQVQGYSGFIPMGGQQGASMQQGLPMQRGAMQQAMPMQQGAMQQMNPQLLDLQRQHLLRALQSRVGFIQQNQQQQQQQQNYYGNHNRGYYNSGYHNSRR